MSDSIGQFVWYELMTSDTAAAEAFYRSVVGWSIKDAGMPGMAYSLLSAGDKSVGGIMALPAEVSASGVPPHWAGYIWVSDVDAYVAKVVAAGGKVCRAADDIPGVGRFAVMGDPDGATFILFTDASGSNAAPAPPNTPGHVGWHELYAGDGASAMAFYGALFGWTQEQAMDMGPMGTYYIFAINGVPSGGMMTRPPAVPVAHWGYYVNVATLDAAVERVHAGGGKVLMGPHEVPGGAWIVNCMDPQGAAFSLVAPQR